MSEIAGQIRDIRQELERLATVEQVVRLRISEADVSNPPTDAELDTAFGTPATMGEGFMALVDDAGAGTAVWLVGVANGAWWYEGLTKAT